jgi:hypothetical protein
MTQRAKNRAGMDVLARDFHGRELPRRAITGVVPGRDFPVVWVCRAERWDPSLADNPDPERGIPWPAEDVKPA